MAEVADDLMTGLQTVALRERDASDWVSSNPAPPSVPSVGVVAPDTQILPGFAVSGIAITDADGADRRPAIRLSWTAADIVDARGVLWEVRLQSTSAAVAGGSTQNVEAGELIVSDGILASTVYEVRAQPVLDRAVDWTAWTPVTTPATLITSPDIAEGAVSIQIQEVALGPFTSGALPVNTVVLTLDIGAIGVGQGWVRRLHFEARGGNFSFRQQLLLQRRRAVLGNPIGPWETTATFDIAALAWDVYADSGNIAGTYDDFEYRLIVSQSPTAYAAGDEILRNVYLTVVRITK